MGGIYIAGPMRGVRHFGFDAFFEAEEWLRRNTTFDPIFNPARRDEGLGFLAREWDLTGQEDLSQPVGYRGAITGRFWPLDDFHESDRTSGMLEPIYFDLTAAMEADNDFIRSDDCSAIVMLPGWGKSSGARDELKLAVALSRRVYFLTEMCGRRYLWDYARIQDIEDARKAEPSPEVARPQAGEVRVTSETGGAKGMKPERHELIPGRAMDAVARVYAFGAEKYDADNWRRGYSWRLSLGALFRHVNAVRKGQWLDPESGQPHLAHAVFHCLTMMQWWYDRNTEQNDIHGLELPEAPQ